MEAQSVPAPTKPMRCGGPTEPRELDNSDKTLFEEFREIIDQKVHSQFELPKDFKIEPIKVRTQVVAGTNYYFHVRLPNGKFAHIKVFKPLKGHVLDTTADRSSFVTVEKETHDD